VSHRIRALAVLGLALSVTTCRDALGPHGTGAGQGRVVFAPILPSEAALASFGLVIDQVRIVVVRPGPPPDTLADTTVALPSDAATLDLDLHVALLSSPEVLTVSVIALSGTTELFKGTSDVEVTTGSSTPTPTEIPVDTYVGPGAAVDSIDIVPAAPFIYLNDSLRFQVQAFQAGLPVTQFYVAWSTSDTAVAHVNGFGVLRAPATRSSVRVRARTPAGVGDSVTVTFVPLPTQLVKIAGDGQSAAAGQALATPLQVEVRGSDNLPVGGVGVRFQKAGGGAPLDTTITTGVNGRAQVTGVLGSVVGAQTFQVTVPAFPAISAVTFNVTATAGAISAATSVVTVSADTVASGSGVTLTLQGKDGAGNNLTTGGASVAFSFSGGTSTGTIGSVTDNGNGTYTATFTGVAAGSATTIGATVNGSAVTTTLPTVSVTPGAISAATSVVTVSSGTVASGSAVTLTLRAKDAAGNNLTTGGATVVFSFSGGTSTGIIGALTDNGNGTYTAPFTGAAAGTPTTIGATVNATPVSTALPTITVGAGAISAATSVVTVSSGTIASGGSDTLTLQAKDAAGNALTTGGATVVFAFSGGTSTGTISAATDNGNGTYRAIFTGVISGAPTSIGATINASPVTTASPTITVTPGAISAATSVVSASSGTVVSGSAVTLMLQAKDAAGNNLSAGGATVVFTRSGGTSTGNIGATTDNGNGTYTATFTGVVAGTATSIGATINATPVTTAAPTISVTPGAISAATSLVTVSSGTVLSGSAVTLTLRAKDQAGNNLVAGGATVVFGFSGGTSTGTIGTVIDNGNGTYAAPFTGTAAGSATTITATINGTPVATTLPTITVTVGAISAATSMVTVSSGTVVSGLGVTLTLQAKDAAGNTLATGGATVAFTASGGTSTGAISSTTDNGNGTYTATFTGVLAGTATTIGATVNGTPVGTALPTVTVTPGAISAATSVVTASSGLISSGAAATLTLQAKDAAGNNLVTGGATVAFTASGGTSTGAFGATTDNGNGTYTATFTGLAAGTATTIGATVNGSPTSSTTPIAVAPGNSAAAQSVITVSSGTVASGSGVTLTLQAKDAAGNPIATGGSTVVFSFSGGTSTGSIVPTPATDNGNGTYTAAFTGIVAGTATTIGATLDGATVTSTLPTVSVTPGAISAATSIVTVSSGTVLSGGAVTLTLQGKDAAGNNLTSGGATVVFSRSGGTSTGTIGATTDNGNGTYTATFTGVAAGTATTIGATINGSPVATALPTITVGAGAISASTSIVTVSSGTVASGVGVTLTLQAKDAAGNNLGAGGATVAFSASGGTSTGTIGATTDNGNGTYTATFTGVAAGTATTIGATINASPVTTTLPTVSVTAGAISAATSLVTVSSDTVASGVGVTLTLQAKDAAGNPLTTGGATVAFGFSGGTSTGSIGATTDNGNGTYTATFTGVIAGAATTIGATVNATPVGTALPTIAVTPGAISAATSLVTSSTATLVSGAGATLTLQAKDAAGNALTTGGATVVFSFSGGTSTGAIGATSDNGNGAYTATFTGLTAGSATTISATVNGTTVGSALPTIAVTPGAVSTVVVSPAVDTVHAFGVTRQFAAEARDANGNLVADTFIWSSSALAIATVDAGGLAAAAGNGTATITATSNTSPVFGSAAFTVAQVVTAVQVVPSADTIRALGNGRVFAAVAKDASDSVVTGRTFTWSSSDTLIAKVDTLGAALAVGNGTATITATTAGVPGTATLLVRQVVASVHVTPDTATLVTPGLTQQFTAQAFDSNTVVVAGKTFSWASTNPLVATVNAAGLATSLLSGVDTITATADGVTDGAVLTILSAVHSADITASETWTAAASPHIVSGYLKILNGATLTIEDGATVKFDTGAGLQLGDSTPTVGQAGSLVMLGTPGSIHLTANTASPVPGFWRGLEVQKANGPLTWRNVDIAYAGGTRPNLIDESCILLVDPAAVIDLDSVHIRQCIHAGVHHAAGTVHVHRSEIDSVTGAGIQSFAGTLQLDSTAIRGSGQMGLILGNGFVNLAGAVANKFTGNAGGSVQMFGRQLPGLGRQDSIAGNGLGAGIGDTIVVDIDSGAVGAGVPAFTIFRQPAPYLVTGFLSVWSASGVTVSLDTGLVMAFDTAAALSVGDFADSTGASSGVSGNLVSLGTAANPVVLRNRLGRPGWEGLFLGAQSGTPVVRHIRLAGGGYQPQSQIICQNCFVKTTGFSETLNTNLYVDAPTGTAPFIIDSVVSDSSHFYGIVVKRAPPQGFRVRDNVIQDAAQTGLVIRAGYNPLDEISGNVISGNQYAVDVVADVLPVFDGGANNLTGNVRDTLLLHGGTLSINDTLPQLGFRWRVTQPMVVDAGAEFTVLAGDTVVFDDLASLTIGGASPAALQAAGTAGAPILFTVTPGGDHWRGLTFANLSPSTVSSVIIERAGGSLPCFGDCNPIPLGAIRYANVSASGLTLDAITVRQSLVMALDVDPGAGSPVLVQNSQFYQNPFSPMIKSPSPLLLAIHGSDLYHYNGQIIQTANAGPDSIDALGNWWGDVGGLERGFEFSDSTGRGSLWFNAVRFDAVDPGPHFPVGPAAQLVPATDTVLAGVVAINSIVGDPDSIRVRALDAEGRGVAGVTIGWGTSSGSFQHPALPTDPSGRAGGVWTTTTAANTQFVQATVAGLIGSPVTWAAFLQPGPTTSVDFQLLQSLSAGVVSVDSNSVAFTSSLRPAALVTHAHDEFGNPTTPQTGYFFTDVPVNTGFQNYGVIDSVKYDTVFFHPTVSTPSAFQLHGNFLDSTGTIQDSVLISMLPVAAGVRLVVDSFDFHSLCPVGGPYNILCRQTFLAFLVDSAGSLLPPDPAYQFSWTNSNPGSVSDSTYGPMNEFADITAHANGTADIIVQQTLGPLLVPDRDTLAVTVNQTLANIAVTPDTVSVGLGDTVTFSATATDQGGAPMPGTVGWRQDAPAGLYLTIIDYPSANSIRVRIDSGYPGFPSDYAAITAFTERGPGDTLLAAGVMYNPIIQRLGGLGSQPWAVGIDPRTNLAYVANRGSANVAVVDVIGNRVVAFQDVRSLPERVTVDSRNARVYVTNMGDGTISVLDGANNGAVLSTITIGPSPGFVAVDTSSNLAFTPAACADPPTCSRGGSYLHKIDGAMDTVFTQDTVQLPANGTGVAFDEVNRRVYVAMINDTVAVVDPTTNKVVGLIGVGTAPRGMAINPVTHKLYVTNSGASSVSVIDLATETVVKTEFLFSNAPERVAVDPIINRIYVAGYGNFLVDQIDGNTDTNIGYRSVNCTYPNDVAINAQNRDLFMPCWSDALLQVHRFLTLP
jgi:YVTN family beta-propeller protein